MTQATFSTNLYKRAVVWLAIILAFFAINFPLQRDYFNSVGDLYLYQAYAQRLLSNPPQLPREYPPLTALVFALPHLLAPQHYLLAFGLLAVLWTWLIVVLVDAQVRRGPILLVYMLVAGAASVFGRFDNVVVLLTVVSFVLAQRKQWVWAQLPLVCGVALKLYPLLLMPVIVLWAWQHNRLAAIRAALVGGGLLLASLAAMLWVAPAQFRTMLQYHTQRPIEVEALGATLAWLLGPVGSTFSFGSANVVSSATALLVPLLTLSNVVALAVVYALFALRRLRPAAACALVLLWAVTTSKVFSTQYVLWVLPFVVLAGERRGVWLLISIATVAIYPVAFMAFEPYIAQAAMPWWFAAIVAVRNALWLAACGIGMWDWVVRKGHRVKAEALSDPSPQLKVTG